MIAGQGIRISATGNSEDLCTCHQGTWIKKALYVITAGGAGTCYVIEGFEDL